MSASREEMFDFVHILDDRKVLVALGDITEQEMGIFTRPFNKNAWIFFFLTIAILLLINLILTYIQKVCHQHIRTFRKISRVIAFLTWFFYMLAEIYYEGALTMFFSTKSENPFENIKDVMRAYPDWKLLMQSGTDIDYLPYVESGDEDYIKFWKRVKKTPDDFVFTEFEKTLSERRQDRVVLPTSQSAVNVYKKHSKDGIAEELEVFGHGSYTYYGLITTKNSPLAVILQHGSNIMSERGAFSYLKTKWLSSVESSCSKSTSSDKTVVTMNHVYLAFVYYSGLLLICIVLLTGEIIFSRFAQLDQPFIF